MKLMLQYIHMIPCIFMKEFYLLSHNTTYKLDFVSRAACSKTATIINCSTFTTLIKCLGTINHFYIKIVMTLMIHSEIIVNHLLLLNKIFSYIGISINRIQCNCKIIAIIHPSINDREHILSDPKLLYKFINREVIIFFFSAGPHCETCCLKFTKEHSLRAFEKRVMRRIFGPKRDWKNNILRFT